MIEALLQERTRLSNKNLDCIIVRPRLASLGNTQKSKSRQAKRLKKNVSNSYYPEFSQNNTAFVYNPRRVTNASWSDNSRNEGGTNLFKSRFRNYFNAKLCIKGKNEIRLGANKLPCINKMKYNFIESIEENLDEDKESNWDNHDLSLLSKTPDPGRKYTVRGSCV